MALLALVLGAGACAPMEITRPGPAPAAPGHAGFDTMRYPGDHVMRAWRQESPFRWVGYYLEAPCHRGSTWTGRRQTLERMGWGLAVLYVGQQTWEGQAPAPITPTTLCSSLLLTAERGALDARDAIQRTQAEGFPLGSVIYLDVERMERIPTAMFEYYEAWQRTVLEDGRFVPGTYAHRINAASLYFRAQRLFEAAGLAATAPFWIAGGTGFTLDARPEDVGLPFAHAWQGLLDVDRTWGGHTLRIDKNVARSPSPSAPLADGGR